MDGAMRVLVVEDSVRDTILIVEELRRVGLQVDYKQVHSREGMVQALGAGSWDLVLSDYSMPQFSGLDALMLHAQTESEAPFIIVSGAIGDVRAAEVVKAGAHNYVLKDDLSRLASVVQKELQAAEERRIRKQTERQAAFLASLVHSCNDAIIGKTLGGTIVSWNAAAEQLYGYTAAEALGHAASMLTPATRPDEWPEILEKILAGQQVAGIETVRLCKNGRQVEVLLTVSPIKDTQGRVIGASSIAHDLTLRKLEDNERLTLIQELTAIVSRNLGERLPPPPSGQPSAQS